mgnify:CR=1 FL=1
MKSVIWLLVLGAAAAALSAQPGLRPVDEKSYPGLIAAHKGKLLVVNFWATWCAPCRQEMPQLAKLAQKYRGRGLELVTVSCDEPEQAATAAQFLAAAGMALSSAYIKHTADDDRFISSVDPKWSGALPALYSYDRNGKPAFSFIGETEAPELERKIQQLLK